MKVYVVIQDSIYSTENSIQGIFLQKQDAEDFWDSFRSERFSYAIKEYEAIE